MIKMEANYFGTRKRGPIKMKSFEPMKSNSFYFFQNSVLETNSIFTISISNKRSLLEGILGGIPRSP